MALGTNESRTNGWISDADGRQSISLALNGVGGAGTIKSVQTSDPAANAELSQTVTAAKTWQLLSISVALVQGITQTPQPILQITDGTNVLFESFGSSAAQAVSTTCQYNWAPGLTLSAQVGATTNVHATAPLPSGLFLPAGYKIQTSTLGKGANSDYGIASILVIEYS
jgi:hypothetical protein